MITFTNQQLHQVLQLQLALLPRGHRDTIPTAKLVIKQASIMQQRAHVDAYHKHVQ